MTRVELIHVEKRIEHWLRFGRPVREQIVDRRRRIFVFGPGSVFAFVRWEGNDYGTIASRLAILRAVERGEPFQTIAGVDPGGDLLLAVEGWAKVERTFQIVDAVEAIGIDPADVAPTYWRHVHNRLTLGLEPRDYSVAQHQAFLLRRRVTA